MTSFFPVATVRCFQCTLQTYFTGYQTKVSDFIDFYYENVNFKHDFIVIWTVSVYVPLNLPAYQHSYTAQN